MAVQVFFARPENPTGSEVLDLIREDIRGSRDRVLVASYSATQTELFDTLIAHSSVDDHLRLPQGPRRPYHGWKGSTADFIRKYGIPIRGRVMTLYREEPYHVTALMERSLVTEEDQVVTWDSRFPADGSKVLVDSLGIKQVDGSWILYRKGKQWPEDVFVDRASGMLRVYGINDVRVLLDADAMASSPGFEQAADKTAHIIQRLIEADWQFRHEYSYGDFNEVRSEHQLGVRLLGRAHEMPFGGRLHHKFIVADQVVWCGSYNLTMAAQRYNYENILRIDDPAVADTFADEFSVLWEFAGPINASQLQVEFECGRCGQAVRGAMFCARRLDVLEYDYPEDFLGWIDIDRIIVCEPCLRLMDKNGVGFLHAGTKSIDLQSRLEGLPQASSIDGYEALKQIYDEFIQGNRSQLW